MSGSKSEGGPRGHLPREGAPRSGTDPQQRRRKLKDWRASGDKTSARSTQTAGGGGVGHSHDGSISSTVRECTKVVEEVDDDGTKSVNEYIIIKTIGKGSFCKVKLCLNTLDNELYAMKVCHKTVLSKRRRGFGNALDHILTEIEVLKSLRHPNIVSLKQVMNDPLSMHIETAVFEYLELGSVIRELDGTPLETELARSYFRDVLKGLEYIHAAGIVHCDIKPDNLLVSAEGKAKIIDFGSSKYIGASSSEAERPETFSDQLEGTPAFMAPELCSSAYAPEEAFKPPRDIWALGACLYCFTTGRLPFRADNVVDLYDQIKNEEPPLADLEDAELVNLLKGLLHKDPTQRLTVAQINNDPWVLRESLVSFDPESAE